MRHKHVRQKKPAEEKQRLQLYKVMLKKIKKAKMIMIGELINDINIIVPSLIKFYSIVCNNYPALPLHRGNCERKIWI